jgi:hypothetical protein
VIQGPFEGEGFSSIPEGVGVAPLAPKPVVVVVAFSSFIYQHDIIQTVIFLSFILHHICIFTYIIDTHIFINIHNWVCTSGLNLAHRSQRVQGTITIVKSV